MPKLQIVQDWGGFEKFVAHIHDDGDVIVQHDQTLMGKSGATRQIDVVVKVKKDLTITSRSLSASFGRAL